MLIRRVAPQAPPQGGDIHLPLNTLPSQLYFCDHLQELPLKQRRLWRLFVNKSFKGSDLQKENNLCA